MHRSMRVLAIGSAACLLAAVSACGSGGGGGDGKEIKVRFASGYPAGVTSVDEVAAWLSRSEARVEKETDYSFEVESFLGGSLVNAADSLAAVSQGRVDVAFLVPAASPAELPLNQLSGVPFLSRDPLAAAKTWAKLSAEDGPIKDEWAEHDVAAVMWAVAGNNTLGLTKPIDSVDDLDGLRVRAIGPASVVFDELGADVAALDVGEVYEGLERGVLDGFATGAFNSSIISSRWGEPAPNIYDLGMGQFTSAGGVVNQKFWDDLPDDVRAILVEEAAANLDGYAESALEPLDKKACDMIEELGGQIKTFPADELASIAERTGPIALKGWKSSAEKAGVDSAVADELVENFRSTEEKFASETDYVDPLEKCVS